jgi:hypothetical protein
VLNLRKGKAKNIHTLELLPRCLTLLQPLTEIENPETEKLGGQAVFSGPDFVDFVCDKITTFKWNPDFLLPMATTLREINMSETQSRGILCKFIK